VVVAVEEQKVILSGQSRSTAYRTETITLTHTGCHFGGSRPWFRCPGVVRGRPCNLTSGSPCSITSGCSFGAVGA
jgi:hypothetical protein